MKSRVSLLLLTCGTNACYHVAKRLKECFGDRIRIIGSDINKGWMVPVLPYLDSFYQCPYTSDSTYYQFILNICMNESIDYILPSFDADQKLFYKGSDDLQKMGVISLGITTDALNIYQSKEDTNRFLEANQLPIPKCYNISEVNQEEEYFCKPRNGVGSIGAKKITGLELLKSQNKDLIIEEICEEPEITLECFNYKGKVYSIARERLGTKSGVCTKARVFHDKELESIAQKFANIIDLPYIFNLQFMQNAQGKRVITDVNLRTAGGMSISYAAGWDEVEALGKIMLNADDVISSVNVQPKEQYIIRAYTDIVTKQIDKRIAFDLDGTLLDSRERHRVVMETVLKENNMILDTSDLLSFKAEGHNNIAWLLKKGVPEDIAKAINKRWVDLIEEERFLAVDALYSNTIDVLSKLSTNNYLVLITARNNRDNANKQIERVGIKQFFDKIIVVETSSKTPELKANYLKSLNIEEFYGDTESDMNAAQEADCIFYASTRGFRSPVFWHRYDVKHSELFR